MPIPIEKRRVPVVNPEGQVVTIREDKLDDALKMGFKVSDAKTLGRAEEAATKEKLYGGALGQTAAVTGGLARGFTLGGSDLLWGAAGAGEEAKLAHDVNPGLATAGELGAIGATLLTGTGEAQAASALSKLGRGGRILESALLAPRTISRVGEATAAGAESLLGTGSGLLARAGRKALSMGAQGAVEGAAYGAGHGISEAALGDQDFAAEKLLSEAGHGAVIGGLAGAAFGGLGELAGSGLRALRSGARGAAVDEAAVGAGKAEGVSIAGADTRAGAESGATAEQHVARNAEQSLQDELTATGGGSRVEVTIGGKPAGGAGAAGAAGTGQSSASKIYEAATGRNVKDLEEYARRPEYFFAKREEVAEKAARDLAKMGDESEDALRAIEPRMMGEGKVEIARDLTDPQAFAANGTTIAADMRKEFADMVSRFEANPNRWFGKQKHIKELRLYSDGLQQEISGIVGNSDTAAGDTFIALDRFKRNIGKIAEKEGSRGGPLQDYYRKLAGELERPDAWGQMAEYQSAVNPKWARDISLGGEAGKAQTATGERSVFNSFAREYRFDPGKLSETLLKAGDTASERKINTLRRWFDNRAKLIDAVLKHGRLSETEAAKVEAAALNAGKSRQLFEDTISQVQAIKKAANADAASPGVMSDLVKMLPGVGSPLSVIVNTNPITLTRRLHSVQKIADRFDSKLGTNLRSYLDSISGAVTGVRSASPGAGAAAVARGRPVVDATKAVARRAIEVATTASRRTSGLIARAGLSQASADNDFESRRAAIMRANADPAATADRIASSVAPMTDVAPNVAAALTSKALAGVSYLASIAPQPPPHSTITPQSDKWHPSQEDQDRWNRAFAVVESGPPVVLDSLRNGTLTREEVGALQAVYPSSFQRMQSAIMDRVAQMDESGKPMSYEHRLQLGLLFSVPADASQEPAVTAALQGVYSSGQGSKGQGGQGGAGSAPAMAATQTKPIRLARPLSMSRFTSSSDDTEKGLV